MMGISVTTAQIHVVNFVLHVMQNSALVSSVHLNTGEQTAHSHVDQTVYRIPVTMPTGLA